MMRDIEFKGLSLESQWVFGDLIKHRFPKGAFKGLVHIENREGDYHYLTPVMPNTVCEFTGEKDIEGKKIFENDIVEDLYGMKFVVLLDKEENRFIGVGFVEAIWHTTQYSDTRVMRKKTIEEYKLVTVGTKFDNENYKKLKDEYDKVIGPPGGVIGDEDIIHSR